MIAIKFSPKYEDRVNIYLKNSGLKNYGVEWNFKDVPLIEDIHLCYWVFKYNHPKVVNNILSNLREMRQIMGVEDLYFQYCYSDKEFFTQQNNGSSIEWFKV